MNKLLTAIYISMFSIGAYAQISIDMNMNKVSQFIFPSKIESIKGGYLPSHIFEDIQDNVLYMQPTGEFDETNLNVITASGDYFYFTLNYSKDARVFSHIIKQSDAFFSKLTETNDESETVRSLNQQNSRISQRAISNPVQSITFVPGYLMSRNSVRYKNIYLTLKGIYVHLDKIYFRVEMENRSNISYDVDMVSFVVKTKHKSKNATQETTSVYYTSVYGDDKAIKANSSQEIVYEFDKFTLGKDKVLNMELIEKDGERNLVLIIDNDWLTGAREVRL